MRIDTYAPLSDWQAVMAFAQRVEALGYCVEARALGPVLARALASGPNIDLLCPAGVEGIETGAVGGFLTFLAVGCPVCNKLALLALGYTGAIQWFAPVQPWLAAGAVVLLGWALMRRLAFADACPVPAARS